MSDKPVFQNSDERQDPEAAPAVPEADVPLFQNMDDEIAADPDDAGLGVGALGMAAGSTAGSGSGTSPSSPMGGAGPALAASEIGQALHDDEEDEAPRD